MEGPCRTPPSIGACQKSTGSLSCGIPRVPTGCKYHVGVILSQLPLARVLIPNLCFSKPQSLTKEGLEGHQSCVCPGLLMLNSSNTSDETPPTQSPPPPPAFCSYKSADSIVLTYFNTDAGKCPVSEINAVVPATRRPVQTFIDTFE